MFDSNFSVEESEILTIFTKILDDLMGYCRISSKQGNYNPEKASEMIKGAFDNIVGIAMKDNKLTFEENQLIGKIRHSLIQLNKAING